MLRREDITDRAPEYRWEEVLEDSGVFLQGSRGQHGNPRRGLYGKFAGILQVEIRQGGARGRMLMIIVCEGDHSGMLVARRMAKSV
jgi:hypothetical protein